MHCLRFAFGAYSQGSLHPRKQERAFARHHRKQIGRLCEIEHVPIYVLLPYVYNMYMLKTSKEVHHFLRLLGIHLGLFGILFNAFIPLCIHDGQIMTRCHV